jgi:hypothetical protein
MRKSGARERIDDVRNERRTRDVEDWFWRLRRQIAKAFAATRREQDRRRYFSPHAVQDSIVRDAWLAVYS